MGRPQKISGQPHAGERIIAAATHLIAERGFEATSLRAVAEAVGMRKQSLLHHFANKEELRRAVLDDLLARWNELLPRLLAETGNGKARVVAIMGASWDFFCDDPDRARVLVRELLDRPKQMRQILFEHSGHWVGLICEAIREGQGQGTVYRDINPEAFVMAMIQLVILGIGTHPAVSVLYGNGRGGERALRGYRDEVVRLALSGMFIPTESGRVGRRKKSIENAGSPKIS